MAPIGVITGNFPLEEGIWAYWKRRLGEVLGIYTRLAENYGLKISEREVNLRKM